jgi:AcrR family transcriptional regulator
MKGESHLTEQPSFREIRYKEKRQKILENAARLFARKGYEKVSLEEIAARLKLNKASLYYYFKSKDEMFFQIQMQAIEQANAALEQVLESEVGPEEKLREAIRSHVNIVTRDYVMGTFRQRELALPRNLMARVIEARDRFEKNFLKIILEGVDKGVFRNKYSKLAVLSILGTLNAIPRWYSPKGELSPEEIGEALAAFILKGLSANK